jgi:hypothetical protein
MKTTGNKKQKVLRDFAFGLGILITTFFLLSGAFLAKEADRCPFAHAVQSENPIK